MAKRVDMVLYSRILDLTKSEKMRSEYYLLKVSIGPVQEFIAEARKTRDLWVGSYLLSMVTYKAMEPFINNGCEIIYPDYENSPVYKNLRNKSALTEELQTATLPNHFLVIVRDGFEKLVEHSKDNYQNYWKGIAENLKTEIQSEFKDDLANWDEQIKDHWQYMWVAIPFDETDSKNYHSYAKEIQKLLEDRKLTRTFTQWKGSSAVKCSQCARRETMGPKILEESSEFWKCFQKKFPANIRKGDRLCAVCLIKRFIQSKHFLVANLEIPKFESTLDIAVKPFRGWVKNSKYKDGFLANANDLRYALGRKKVSEIDDIEAEFFYIDEMDENRLCWEHEIADAKKKSNVKEAVGQLRQVLGEIQKVLTIAPSRYYAIIFTDGDDIGKWLSGERPAGVSFSKDEHKARSGLLGELAVETAKEIKKFQAEPIYSGGDDVLAMAGVDDIFTLAVKIREYFSTNGINPSATTSAGIVITHASEPFQSVLKEGREAVKTAKRLFKQEKDAFYINLIISTGIRVTFGYHWFITQNGSQISVIDNLILRLASWIKKDLSPQFIYDVLDRLDYFFHYEDSEKMRFNEGLFRDEIKRLFTRHWASENPPTIIDETISLMTEIGREKWEKNFNIRDNLEGLLRISTFLARESCELK